MEVMQIAGCEFEDRVSSSYTSEKKLAYFSKDYKVNSLEELLL